jgi:predicted RNA-binding Zn-ribbon protein involved in translation (DUF1610 family)
MRDKIAKLIETENAYGYYAHDRAEELADQILSLINAERCVWTYDDEREWVTSCGEEILDDDTYGKYPYCPCCGKRIEVKDAD